MSFLETRPQLRFWLTVLALLPACFVLWHYLAVLIAIPSVLLAEPILQAMLPDLVASAKLQGSDLLVVTTVGESNGRIIAAEEAGNQIAFPVNTRVLSYSFPFFWALHFATRERAKAGSFTYCLAVLWLLLLLGLVSTGLKELMVGLGSTFNNSSPPLPREIIALLYQFSTLMVPPLAPVVLWAYTSRDSPDFRDLLPSSLRPAQARERDS